MGGQKCERLDPKCKCKDCLISKYNDMRDKHEQEVLDGE